METIGNILGTLEVHVEFWVVPMSSNPKPGALKKGLGFRV